MRDFRQIQNTRRLADEALLRSRSAGGAGGIDQLTGEVTAGPGTGSQVARMGPRPVASQIVYVNKGGSDATGNGTIGLPFLTIGAAQASITDASPSKLYVVTVGPGTYAESIVLKSGVYIEGPDIITTTLTGGVSLDPAFPANGQTGLLNFNILGDSTFTYSATPGFVDNVGVVYSGNLTVTGVDDSCSFTLDSCICDGNTAVFTTCNFFPFNTSIANDVTLQSAGAVAATSEPESTYFAKLTISAPGAGACDMNAAGGSVVGPLLVTGANASYTSTADGFPSGFVVAGGASVTLGTTGDGIQYDPTNLANWSGVGPSSIGNALDRIAAKIGPIP
jgi:hypothetical protein